MSALQRRYDIDWIRVIAIGLLLLYHVAIGFQPWGTMIGFIANDTSWASLWIPMAILNIWRIPLLFFVSGMGVYFAMQKRNWIQLISERAGRILLPLIFGMFALVPIHMYIWQSHYNLRHTYSWDSGHLWFLGNIFLYVLLFLPLFYYLKSHEDGKLARTIKKLFSSPLGLLVMIGGFIAEVMILHPRPFELYAKTQHGFYLGLLAFFFGFCFVLAGKGFTDMTQKGRWVFLIAAISLFIVRITQFKMNSPGYLLSIESNLWILAVLSFGYRFLNKPSGSLSYLSQAAYPVYILHMIFLYLGAYLIFQLDLPVEMEFLLALLFTFAGCFGTFEIIRRVQFLRPLFGLKLEGNFMGNKCYQVELDTGQPHINRDSH